MFAQRPPTLAAARLIVEPHLGHDVLTVDYDAGVARCAQRDLQRCAILADVDLFAAEHRIDASAHIAYLRQLKQQFQRSSVMWFFE